MFLTHCFKITKKVSIFNIASGATEARRIEGKASEAFLDYFLAISKLKMRHFG